MTHHEFLDRLGLGPDKMPELWRCGCKLIPCDYVWTCPQPRCLIPDPRLPTDDRNVLLCGEFMREELGHPMMVKWGSYAISVGSFGIRKKTEIQALAAACEVKWMNEDASK